MKKSSWKKVKLKNICKTNTNSYSEKENWKFVNYLETGNITQNFVTTIEYIDLNKEKLPSRAKRKVSYDDIIYSTVRPNQKHYGIIKETPENFLVSTGFCVISVDKRQADPNFIYYLLSQETITARLQTIANLSVSAYPSITPTDIENLDVDIPPLEEQKKIASFLSNIDNKILVNQKINHNLYH